MASTGLDRKHLSAGVVERLLRYSFGPRKVLDGHTTGRHASPQRGQSVEFRDYRAYAPGDSVAQIDWKVFGRTDKLYVRRFEHETQWAVTLLVDASASMAYPGSRGRSKFDHACCLAAALGFLVLRGQDRVGFAFAHEGLRDYRPLSTHWHQFIHVLDQMQAQIPRGQARTAAALSTLATKCKRGEVVIVCTDLWEDLDSLRRAAAQIAHRGAELIVFHVLHADELSLPAWDPLTLIDSESGERLRLDPNEMREAYGVQLRAHLDRVRAICREVDARYEFAPMTENFLHTLERFLQRRATP